MAAKSRALNSDHSEFRHALKEIRQRFSRRQPLNITAIKRKRPELLKSFFQPENFIGWRKALEIAGIAYSDIQVELAPTVACLLCGKESAAISLHLRRIHQYTKQDYLKEFPDAELMSEETRAQIFGVFSRHKTIRETRALVPHWEHLWSPEYALDRLVFLRQLGHSIHWQHLYTAEKALGAYLLRAFGSYDRALAAVGLDPKEVRHLPPARSWSRENILNVLRKRAKAGKSLTYAVVEKECGGFANAASKHFGTYGAAIEELGIDYKGEVKLTRWRNTPALRTEIMLEARRLAAMPKYDWKATETFRKKYRPAIQPLFRSWHGLAAAAGVPVERIIHKRFRMMERDEILDAIRQRHNAGKPLNDSALSRPDHKLSTSILTHFENLSDAMREAGVATSQKGGRRML